MTSNGQTLIIRGGVKGNLRSADLTILQATLGIDLRDLSLLEQSLVHRSYINENQASPLSSNERLEFLGDALLSFVIADKLCSEFPHLPEGKLTQLRAALVCNRTLARIASSLCLGDYLYLGLGEEKSGGRRRQRILAATLEAVIGAVFADQGFIASKDLILRLLDAELGKTTAESLLPDHKSKLQEHVQSQQWPTPVYRTIDAAGPDHDKVFTVEVLTGDTIIGKGSGKSKQAAEQEAAKAALAALVEKTTLRR